MVVRRPRGGDADGGVGVVARHRLVREPAPGGGVGHHDLGAAQAGGVEGLGRGHHRDGVVVRALDREVGDVLGAGQDQRRVDLVADDAGTVAYDDVADPLQLGAGEHPAPRVVGLREQQRLRPVGEEPVEAVEVDLRAVGRGRHLEQVLGTARHPGQAVLGVVAGRREDDSARTAEHVDRQPHPGRHVHHRVHGHGVGRPAEVPRRPAGVRLRERRLPHQRVAGDAVGQHPLHGLEHHRVDRVVHLGDPRGDHVVRHAPLQGQPVACLRIGEVDDRTPLPRHGRLRPARGSRPPPRPARWPRPAVRRCPGGRRGSGRRPHPSRRRRRRRSS